MLARTNLNYKARCACAVWSKLTIGMQSNQCRIEMGSSLWLYES